MSWCRGTSHIVDLVHFKKNRKRHVVPNQFKVRTIEQVDDVGLLARKKVVEADHVVAFIQQSFAKV